MFGPDSGSGSWHGLNFMFEQVRISSSTNRQKRVNAFLQASLQKLPPPFPGLPLPSLTLA